MAHVEPEPEYVEAGDWTVPSGGGVDERSAAKATPLTALRDTWMRNQECSLEECTEAGRLPLLWPGPAASPQQPPLARKRRIKAGAKLHLSLTHEDAEALRAGQSTAVCLAVPAAQLQTIRALERQTAQQETPSPPAWKIQDTHQHTC
eukprot:COSAG01_NODE_28560_length_658_cov_1.012522_1_plen_147_part_01